MPSDPLAASRMSREPRPIVIRRPIVAGGHGHHGGAWKVAYADFVTAMMAFFLLLWLISSASDETKKGLADFFSNATVNIGPPGGVGGVLDGMTVMPSSVPPLPTSPFDRPPELPSRARGRGGGSSPAFRQASMPPSSEARSRQSADAARERTGRLRSRPRPRSSAALQVEPELRGLKDSLLIEEAPEGLRVQILDRDRLPMFPVGSDAMYPHTRRLLEVVVEAIADTAQPDLAARAHRFPAVRRGRRPATTGICRPTAPTPPALAMIEAGLDPGRVAEVVGKADAEPLVAIDPADPRNRRISVVLLRASADRRQPAQAGASPAGG